MIERKILQRLFCQHYSEMFRLARTLLYDTQEAEDAVQDVFVRLMQSDIAPAEEKARAYLMAAVRNGCINRIRQKSLAEQVRNLYTREAEADWQNTETQMQAVEAVCDYADNHLTEPHRTIFQLRFRDGLTLKEIAQRMDMNLKTVFKYLSQSIQSVQKVYRH